MRIKATATSLLVFCLTIIVPIGATTGAGTGQKHSEEVFSALAQLPLQGSTINVKIFIRGYSNQQDAQRLHSILADGGPRGLLKTLQKMKSLGSIQREGAVGFYDFKFILSTPTANGRHIYAVADRPIGFLEAYYSTRSRDYPFGILELDLKADDKEREKGEGTLIYAAKIKLLDSQKVDIENVTFAPIKLLGVRQL